MGYMLFAALAGGVVSAILGGIQRNKNQEDLDAQWDAEKASIDADRAAFEASWAADMEEARVRAEELAAGANQAIDMARGRFNIEAGELETAFGSGGTAWAGFEGLILKNAEERGAFSAAAGASGLKNTGTIEALGLQVAEEGSRSEAVMRRGVEGQMNSSIAGMNMNLSNSIETANRSLAESVRMRTEWAGFNWETFVAGADGGGAETFTQRLYRTRKAAGEAGYDKTRLRYELLKKENQNTFLTALGDFFGGGQAGLGIGNALGLNGQGYEPTQLVPAGG